MRKKLNLPKIFPEVGMGATLSVGSDRFPVTIIQVTQSGKRIVIQEDEAIRTDDYGMSEIQTYAFVVNTSGTIHIATLRKGGLYRITGRKTPVYIGERSRYHNFSY